MTFVFHPKEIKFSYPLICPADSEASEDQSRNTVTSTMPPLDREPRPWSPPSSKSSAARSCRTPVFPALKRVQQNSSGNRIAGKAGVKPNTHPEAKTSASSSISPGNLFRDNTPPIPEKSALGTVEQHGVQSTAPSEDAQTTVAVQSHNDGRQPIWHFSTQASPSALDLKGSLSWRKLTPKVSLPLTAKVGKSTSRERRRQARSTEDNRLVENARRSASGLIQRTRQPHPGTLSSEKKPSPYVGRGRTLERQTPRRRGMVMTDSPKPHVGRKSSVAAKSSAGTASSSMKPMSSTIASRPRGTYPSQNGDDALQPEC